MFLPELSHRFWKFTLQILSRYKTWLEKSLPVYDITSKGVAAALVAEVDKVRLCVVSTENGRLSELDL